MCLLVCAVKSLHPSVVTGESVETRMTRTSCGLKLKIQWRGKCHFFQVKQKLKMCVHNLVILSLSLFVASHRNISGCKTTFPPPLYTIIMIITNRDRQTPTSTSFLLIFLILFLHLWLGHTQVHPDFPEL